MIILSISVGNSRTSFGIFNEERLLGTAHTRSASFSSIEKTVRYLRQLFRQRRISPEDLSGVVISSVVPELTKKIRIAVKQHVHLIPLIVSGTVPTGLRITYDHPQSLGADRICGAVAAYHKFGGPIIVVDAGTATTINVITKNGTFLGGAIAPGIQTAASALHRQTAQLPEVDLRFPKNVIGKNTIENIQSGILYGALYSIEGIIQRIKDITGKNTKVIFTGGFSDLLRKKTNMVDAMEPALVLEGALLIYNRFHRLSK